MRALSVPGQPARDVCVALDRYVILARQGQGGDGVVYRAWDPELDRPVAIKVLRRRGAEAEKHLLHEARLLAKLRHPNIVQIHDVERHAGDVDRAGMFFVMQYLPGGDLSAWLARRPRSWRAIVRMYAAVARALAAAHEVGVVHRDVKPSNVLLGDDGEPRVVDFGLAQGRDAAIGGIAGTLPYMAPEQHRGELPDARADQYGLGVALYEALVGERPFLGNAAVMLRAKERGAYPRIATVPRRVVRTVARALAPDPADRFADMHGLARALEAAASDRVAKLWSIAGVTAAAATLGLFALRRDPCELPERTPATLWAERGALPSDEATVRVGAIGSAWSLAWQQACASARVDAEVSPAVYQAQLGCFDRQTDAFAGALDELHHQRTIATATPTIEALALDSALEPASACAVDAITVLDPEAARAWGPDTAWRDLARARVLHALGADADALAVLRGIEASTMDLDAPLLRARQHLAVAESLAAQGEFDAAKQRALQALWTAEPSRDHLVAARAWLELAWIDGVEREDPESSRWLAFATSAVARTGDDARLLADLHHLRGGLHYRAGDFAAADREYEAALAIQRALVGEHHPWTARTRNHLGNVAFEAGRIDDAIEHSTSALQTRRATLAPEHPLIAAALNNLAGMYLAKGDLSRARANLDAAVASTRGQGGPAELFARILQGRVAIATGRPDVAAEGFRAALGVRMAQVAPDHRAVLHARTALAGIERRGAAHFGVSGCHGAPTQPPSAGLLGSAPAPASAAAAVGCPVTDVQ